MPRPVNAVPAYQQHKASGQAYVRVTTGGVRRVIYLGKYDTPESRAEYRRVIAELEITGPASVATRPDERDTTINELLLAYLTHAAVYYRDPDGNPTSEVDQVKRSVTPLRELYGHQSAARFTPMALETVRQRMIDSDLCRKLINKRIDRVRRVFKWGVSKGIVPVGVYEALRTLTGLRAGRTSARERDPVKPADPVHVAATLPFLNRHAAAMVELQRLTGMRPGEVCKLKLGEVDCSGDLWLYTPGRHKTAHHGKERVIPLGPKAQEVIVGFLVGGKLPPNGLAHVDLNDSGQRGGRLMMADVYQKVGREGDAALLRDTARSVVLVAGCVVDPRAPLFSPKEAREERYRAMRTTRKSKVPPSQMNRRATSPKRPPTVSFNPVGYAKAVARASRRAGAPHWHPNQLRHLLATEVRKTFGLEAAQVVLGHSNAAITQVYAERDLTRALMVAQQIG
ncbi:tyrosine-type recombinase/integrase [Gemmata sp. G18]|uniref:Tyrosine-type recombinase/integrase n=1 Tax=Gemmata palustris TaxID=2822762 RepID=A0ABS5C0L9_9BACT|nr:site-specific integrase [Gemmata palustris]MBP3959536.1 tyrosine-type recombinase/integrase [Gemmata palustris]